MRELVSKIQQMRKDSGFDVVDHIRVYLTAGEEITKAVKDFEDRIKSDVLADGVYFEADPDSKEWDVNGKPVKLAVKRV